MSRNATKQKRIRLSAGRERHDPALRRAQEIFGILTLACAALIGPSLACLHLGKKQLMGPFGEVVGYALNWALGLTGYVVVLLLLGIATRIFANALGKSARAVIAGTLWRERTGGLLAIVFSAVLIHLAARPRMIHGASLGGALGELAAELLCALVSTPGTWVIAITGLATSIVLATNISVAGLALGLWSLIKAVGAWLNDAVAVAHHRVTGLVGWMAHQLRRPEFAADADGAAVLPPMVDLSFPQPREARARRGSRNPPAAALMPADLEIGKRCNDSLPEIMREVRVDPRLVVENTVAATAAAVTPPAAARRAKKAPKAERGTRAGDAAIDASMATETTASPSPGAALSKPQTPAQVAGTDSASAKVPADRPLADVLDAWQGLTIVKPQFEQQADADAKRDEARPVEAPTGPGFELYDDVYRLPPLSLLQLHAEGPTDVDRDAIYQQADRLTKALSDYGIDGRVTKVHPGPVVTMYEFVPAPGTRVNKVASLCNDLAMSLHAQRVRIVAPIPGKGAIGIEVPNETREVVSLKEILCDDAFRATKAKLALALGKNIFGAPIVVDLAKMPHLLVAGATGAGKSVSINAIICSLLFRCTPEEVRLILIDPKFLELSDYNDIPHLLMPVVTDPKRANIALRWAVAEMERRYQLLAEMRVRDIHTFNRKVDRLRRKRQAREESAGNKPLDNGSIEEARPSKVLVVRKEADGSEVSLHGLPTAAGPGAPSTATGSPVTDAADDDVFFSPDGKRITDDDPRVQHLPLIVVIVDEFADLMMVASKDVETSIARLAQKARAAGIHLIVATQRPSVDVITGLIKANFPSRVAFQVASGHDSKTILGCQGAENLLGAGDMIVLDRGVEMKRIHGAFIADGEIQGVTEWVKKQGRPIYDLEMLKRCEEEEDGGGGSPAVDEDHDDMYDQAVSLVAETRQASISMIQRRLRVGYNRAARMVERMEREGIVGPADGVRGREVLVSHHGIDA